jgi:transcriptional regulator with XRE-family HTH domain
VLGGRIRSLRTSRGYSVRELARRAGVSVGLVSQVEREINDPSLQTLRVLAKALDAPLFDLFQPSPTSDVAVVRKNSRVALSSSHGDLTYLRISAGSGRLEMLEGILEPHAASTPELWGHPSEECAVVTAGCLVLELAGQHHELEAGDSCHFDSHLPHRYVNPSEEPVRFLVAITPPSY